jgi:hypothetical protein
MSQFSLSSCTLNLPENSCSEGHMLTLCIVPEETKSEKILSIPTNGIPGSITILGKVKSCESSKFSSQSIQLEFTQFIEKEWEKFMGSYEKRQSLANKILEQVKS